MLIHDWPRAIAHIDADCFYAACELVRRPDLAGRPLAVMSSQDACIVAKTYDAKARGISTGMPVWEARRLMPELVLLPADFRYYGLMSRRMFAVLERFSPGVERYSIDEGFADFEGLRGLHRCGYEALAERIRRAVREEVGIPVSIGVSVNKLLAKMASESAKPDGCRVVPGRRIEPFLETRRLEDVPGIGRRRAALLSRFGMRSARDLARAAPADVRRWLGKTGRDLQRELNGEVVFPLELVPRLPKTMARTASLGLRTRDPALVRRHLMRHAFRLSMDLVRRGIAAGELTVMLRLGNFERIGAEVPLGMPTQDYRRLARAAARGLTAVWPEDAEVSGCGVIGRRLCWMRRRQPDLFGELAAEERALPLWQAVDEVNHRFGSGRLRPARCLEGKTESSPARFRYPLLSAR